jgi:N-ATPase, AtpR subunit
MDAQAMMHFAPALSDLIASLLWASAWLPVGMAIGAFQFITLRWVVGMLAAGRSTFVPFGTQLARLVLIAAALAIITRLAGALPLLGTTAGILIARTAMLRSGARR